MLVNFQREGDILGKADLNLTSPSPLYYYDFPWCISYYNYIKKRDGAHRRSVMRFLGHRTIPSLVCHFTKIEKQLPLLTKNSFIIDNFYWYQELIAKNYQSGL